jgi:hypothetical protein
MPIQSFFIEENWIKSPADQRVISPSQRLFTFCQSDSEVFDIVDSTPLFSVGVFAIVESHIGVSPNTACHHVAMPLDEAGQQNTVAEGIVYRKVAPVTDFLQVPGSEYAAIPD